MKVCSFMTGLAAALLLTGAACLQAQIVVTAAGLSTANSTNWLSQGLGTLNGQISGVDWAESGLQEGSDWIYISGGNQNTFSSPTTEWPSIGAGTHLGYVYSGDAVLGIGSTMAANVLASGGNTLVISEVTPGAGDFTLNGVTQTATAVGQVLEWTVPEALLVVNQTLTFSSDALLSPGVYFSSGPIAFSAETISVPEPATWALGGGGLAFLLWAPRFRRLLCLIMVKAEDGHNNRRLSRCRRRPFQK